MGRFVAFVFDEELVGLGVGVVYVGFVGDFYVFCVEDVVVVEAYYGVDLVFDRRYRVNADEV